MEFQEHKKLHNAENKGISPLSERLTGVARELYESLTSGMRKNESKENKTATDKEKSIN